MRRRNLLLGLSSSLLTACATPSPTGAPPASATARIRTPVPPVLVQRGRILQNIVGLRPWREGGFKLSEEPFNGKHLIHNYGHGGDGVSLSWGCARVAAEMAYKGGQRDIAVLGAGVMGLTTGLILAGWDFNVTLYAENFPPNTTSNIAGALILVPDSTPPRIADLSHAGWEPFIGRSGYGVKRVNHYRLGHKGSDASAEGFLGRVVRSNRSLVMVDPGLYLTQMMADFRMRGGKVFTKRFATTADVLALRQPTIINCTGLGAGDLFLDRKVQPQRGQLTLLRPQPEIDYSYIAAAPGLTSLYMFPRETSIVLGGTREVGNASTDVDHAIVDRLLKDHAEMARWAGGPGHLQA